MESHIQTLVIKIGTTLLSGPEGFNGQILEQLVKEIAALKQERDINILVVSSGAIGCGMNALRMKERPKVLPLKQATAAIGQAKLMHFYETLFRLYGNGLCTAQVLITVKRDQYAREGRALAPEEEDAVAGTPGSTRPPG